MRSVIVLGLGLLTLCAGHILAEAPAPAEKAGPAGPKWEYKVLTREAIIDLGGKDFTVGLNKLGDDSWELVMGPPGGGIAAPATASTTGRGEYYFKRPKARAAGAGEQGKTGTPKAEARNEDWEILKLKSASAVEFAKTAEALFGGKAGGAPRVVAEPTTNSVLVLGTPRQVEDLRRLLAALDVPEAIAGGAADMAPQVDVLHLKYAKVAEIVKVLQDVYGKDTQTHRLGPDERTNTLIVSATRKQLDEIRRLLQELDVPVPK